MCGAEEDTAETIHTHTHIHSRSAHRLYAMPMMINAAMNETATMITALPSSLVYVAHSARLGAA